MDGRNRGVLGTMNVVAFDPGGTTGIATRINGELITCTADDYQSAWEFIQPGLDVVIYERFASAVATSHDALYTIELVGGIKALCWHYHVPIIRHEPQNRIAYLEEAKTIVHAMRKEAGEKLGEKARHEYDALAHLLCHEKEGTKIVTRRWGRGISNA